jgi:peptide-methionine (S)-S-oxide reductase
LLEVFWHNVDPVDAGGQFCDRGEQYRSAIFYENGEQKRLAEQSKDALVRSKRLDKPIVTPIAAATTFYPAEEYHQDYYKKNPLRYRYYRASCGRDRRLAQLWGADAAAETH